MENIESFSDAEESPVHGVEGVAAQDLHRRGGGNLQQRGLHVSRAGRVIVRESGAFIGQRCLRLLHRRGVCIGEAITLSDLENGNVKG